MATITKEELEKLRRGEISATDIASDDIQNGTFVGKLVGEASTAIALSKDYTLSLVGDAEGVVQLNNQDKTLEVKVNHAKHSDTASFVGQAQEAQHASFADLANLADHAKTAESVLNSDYADKAEVKAEIENLVAQFNANAGGTPLVIITNEVSNDTDKAITPKGVNTVKTNLEKSISDLENSINTKLENVKLDEVKDTELKASIDEVKSDLSTKIDAVNTSLTEKETALKATDDNIKDDIAKFKADVANAFETQTKYTDNKVDSTFDDLVYNSKPQNLSAQRKLQAQINIGIATQGIGTAGRMGFGVGIYPHDNLRELGLFEMQGTRDVWSDNYGNYQDAYGGFYVFIPAFYFRYGDYRAPQFAIYGVNSLEIKDYSEFANEEEALKEGYVLHRAFIDGGKTLSGFFVSKYFKTKFTVNNQTVWSGKNWNEYTGGTPLVHLTENITARSVQPKVALATVFAFSAIKLLTLAHAQTTNNSIEAIYYDPTLTANYPQITNNVNTTQAHNGQKNGIYFYAGCLIQQYGITTAGATANAEGLTEQAPFYVLKREKSIYDLTAGWGEKETDHWGNEEFLDNSPYFDKVDLPNFFVEKVGYMWGNSNNPIWYTDYKEKREQLDCFGIFPRDRSAVSLTGINMIGTTAFVDYPHATNMVVNSGYHASPFYQIFNRGRTSVTAPIPYITKLMILGE